MSEIDDTIDWSLTTYEGSRRDQMRRAAKIPFDRLLDTIEEMADLAANLAAQAKKTCVPTTRLPQLPQDSPEVREHAPQYPRPQGQSEISPPNRTIQPPTTSFSFDGCFEALTGHNPMQWQKRLFEQMVSGHVPPSCELPTGIGKTSIIPIWLIALAIQSHDSIVRVLPRRLVYIVNRRTVVDQATEIVERIRERLRRPSDNRWVGHQETLRELCRKLRALSASGDENTILGVSTLRGQLADNEEWKADPARPAIVVGTIDMIGSKLLFSGYGDGKYRRAHHAGLIGQDVVLVHDEAHLSPAFSRLLWSVEREQREAAEERPINVMELSATSRLEPNEDRDQVMRLRPGNNSQVFKLEGEEREEKIVKYRLQAIKQLRLETIEGSSKNALVTAIVERAAEHENKRCRVLIYVRGPETAQSICDALAKKIIETSKRSGAAMSQTDARARIGLLTGTIRGFERDQLVASDLFQRFKSEPNRPMQLDGGTLYLVSTSAGEVGTDLDADHLVCDLSTLDAIAQRLGRVNRLGGENRAAEIAVIVERMEKKQSRFGEALAATETVLSAVAEEGSDVSPDALERVLKRKEAEAAFSPKPSILPATAILFDAWSLTSVSSNLPGRPEVGPYLHGVAEWEPPETHVAWRMEIADLAEADVQENELEEIFDAFPLHTVELLRDKTERVFNHLALIAQRHADAKAIIIKNNKVRWLLLSELAPTDKNKKEQAKAQLSFATVVLPVGVGGLKAGCLDGNANQPVEDVAEILIEGQKVRQRTWVTDEAVTPLVGKSVAGGLVKKFWLKLGDAELAEQDNQVARTIEYRVAKVEARESATIVLLTDHSTDIEVEADRIGEALLGSDEQRPLRQALALAARWHDRGKDRPVWQRYAQNDNLANPIAKAEKYLHSRALGGYRHEFGSVLAAMHDAEIAGHAECDLILHLIAAHHGWARPHFEPRSFDHTHTTAENTDLAMQVMRCFGRLQHRFGRWGLAWLESLLRCADITASKAVASEAVPASEEQKIVL